MLVTNPSAVPVPPAQDLCSGVGCWMTRTQGCWLGKQGTGGTIENSQDFLCKFQGNAMVLVCVTSCYNDDVWKCRSTKWEMQDQPHTPCFCWLACTKPKEVEWFPPWCSLQTWSLWLKDGWLPVGHFGVWLLCQLLLSSILNVLSWLLHFCSYCSQKKFSWSLFTGILVLCFTLAITAIIMKILFLVNNFR